MLKHKKKLASEKQTYKVIFIIFFFICIFVGIFSFQYYDRLQDTIRDESVGYLKEISRRIEGGVNRFIDDNYSVLNTMASVLEDSEAESFSDISLIVESQQEYWNYQNILFVDEEGHAFDSSGKAMTLNNDSYFYDAVVDKRNAISTTQLVDNKECIVLVIPLENMVIEEKNMVALAASYDPASFDQTLSMSAFDGQAYSCIINKIGTVVVRSSSLASQKVGYNVLTTIGASDIDPGYSIDKVRSDIQSDIEGQIVLSMDGVKYYMVYTPIASEDWYLLTFVPTSAVNEKSDMLMRLTLLFCGLITVVFAGLIAFLVYSFYRNKRQLEQIAFIDEVTGGNTIQRFYILSRNALDTSGAPQYALIYTNLEKFKVLNEQFGRTICDNILHTIYNVIASNLKSNECIGRITADNFCILLQYEDEATTIKRFEEWYAAAEEFVLAAKPSWSLPVAEFGIYIIENDTIPFPQMIDRAKLALKELPRNINNRMYYAIYDDEVRRQLFREKQLEDMIDSAMKNHEFQVYLQPKYRADTLTIGGAEALVRWVSATEGIIFPDEFIPLFEKNGFIMQLDLLVFEDVCRTIRSWIDSGLQPVKISVNCSRVHLKRADFINDYRRIAYQYNIPNKLIEIELTESIVMEDSERLTSIIATIHQSGFGCSMDDFGSGYSSLNLLQSIPVDTLKLDKIFFRNASKDPKRMESIISSVISMAKALSMVTVAEGVEQQDQVQMLQKLGCDYIQGYVFAKPMPIPEFESLAFPQHHDE